MSFMNITLILKQFRNKIHTLKFGFNIEAHNQKLNTEKITVFIAIF